MSGKSKVFDLCFTDNTRVTSNSGVYWGVDALDYLRLGGGGLASAIGGMGDVTHTFAVTLVQKATSNYDATSAALERPDGQGLMIRMRFFNGKIRSLEAVWTAKYNAGGIDSAKNLIALPENKLLFNQATAVCKAYGVQDTISWDKFVSLPEPSADDIFMVAHNTQACKIVHLAMLVYSDRDQFWSFGCPYFPTRQFAAIFR